MLVAHRDQKEVQQDRVVGEPRSVIAEKATIDPGPAFSRRAAHAVGKEHLLVDHDSAPRDLEDMAKLTLSSPRPYRRRPHVVLHRSMPLDANLPGRRCPWWHAAGVSPGPLGTPSDASSGRPLSCGTSTCVRDLARDAWPGSTRRRSSVRELESKLEGVRNSRADRKSARQEFFYCVTTRLVADRGRR